MRGRDTPAHSAVTGKAGIVRDIPPLPKPSGRISDALPGEAYGEAFDPSAILASIGEIAYDWDLTTDRLRWAGDPRRVLKLAADADLSCGAGLSAHLVGSEDGGRAGAIYHATSLDNGSGVRFALSYRLRDADGQVLAVDDQGRWFAGQDGRPMLAQGVLRVRQERAEPETRLADSLPIDLATGAVAQSELRRLIADALGQRSSARPSCALLLVRVRMPHGGEGREGDDRLERALGAASARLRSVMRRRDILARAGADRMAVILQACDMEQLKIAADRFNQALHQISNRSESQHIELSLPQIAIAGAVTAADTRDPDTLIDAAQAALETALAAAPGTTAQPVLKTSHQTAPKTRRDIDWSHEAVRALNERRFMIALQPVVHARSRTPAFHEALLRIREPGGSVVTASGFVATLEKLGLAPLIDVRALELTMTAMEHDPTLIASLNVSPITLRTPEWLDAMQATLRLRPDFGKRLIVEITETAAVEEVDTVTRAFEQLRQWGVRTAIDDFGAGHSSFKILRTLPVDIVKIDGLFVQNLDSRIDDRFFVRTLADLARHLKLQVVAEWVETEAVARIVEAIGVDYLQGDLFGAAAMPGERASALRPAVA